MLPDSDPVSRRLLAKRDEQEKHQEPVENDVFEEEIQDGGSSISFEGAAADADAEIDTPDQPEHQLFARNLCPACPSSANVAAAGSGKQNSGSTVYCCPGRKTISSTIIRTRQSTLVIRKTILTTSTRTSIVSVTATRTTTTTAAATTVSYLLPVLALLFAI
jgi:hypothetical protein